MIFFFFFAYHHILSLQSDNAFFYQKANYVRLIGAEEYYMGYVKQIKVRMMPNMPF